jgi:hypothetical protein
MFTKRPLTPGLCTLRRKTSIGQRLLLTPSCPALYQSRPLPRQALQPFTRSCLGLFLPRLLLHRLGQGRRLFTRRIPRNPRVAHQARSGQRYPLTLSSLAHYRPRPLPHCYHEQACPSILPRQILCLPRSSPHRHYGRGGHMPLPAQSHSPKR